MRASGGMATCVQLMGVWRNWHTRTLQERVDLRP